jgi:ComF family protein
LFNLKDYIKDFFFPRICIITNIKLKPGNSNGFIDDSAFANLDRIKPEEMIEMRTKVKSDYFNSYLSFKKDNSVQTAIHYLKYNGFFNLGVFLGNYFGNEYIKTFPRVRQYDIICPVPLFKTKLRERGYNQSEYICNGINRVLKIRQINNLVVRIRHTKSQTNLKYFERLSNVKDAFQINPDFKNIICGKSVLLVDDVMTTGATINEVIKTLRNEDAKEISALTIASAGK